MALLADAQVQLLSEKWRSTILMVVVILCITAVGIVLSVVTKDVVYGLGAIGLILAITGKALALDIKKAQEAFEKMKPPKIP